LSGDDGLDATRPVQGHQGSSARASHRNWVVGSVAFASAIAIADAIAGNTAILISFLIVAPLLTSLGDTVRATAAVAGYSLALALLLGVADEMFLSGDHLVRVAVVASGSLMALGVARVREDRERALRLISLQQQVAHVLTEADSLSTAAPAVLEVVGTTLGWQAGSLWTVDRTGRVLERTAAWHTPDVDVDDFERMGAEMTLDPGIGLAGRVWQSGEPLWMEDILAEKDFPRAPAAAKAGLRAALGWPVTGPSGHLGAFDFFAREPRRPDPEVIEVVTLLGAQIGHHVERQRDERVVRDSEALKTGILNSSLDCVVSMDHHGRVVEFNPAAEATFGYTRDKVIGREMADLIIPERNREKHRRGLAHYLETGDAPILNKRLEMSACRADGKEFPVELAITRVPTEGPPLFTGFIRDITERKRVEDERNQSLALVDALFSGAPIGLAFWDTELRYQRVNDSLAAMNGIPVDEHIGRPLLDVVPDLTGVAAILRQVVDTGNPVTEIEVTGETPAQPGVARHWLASYYPVSGAHGEVVGVGGAVLDITTRKRAERGLHAAERRATFLAEAGALLTETLDYQETLNSVSRLVVPQIADWCVVDLLQPDGSLERVAAAHTDPDKTELGYELQRRWPPRPGTPGVPAALEAGHGVLYREVTDELLRAASVDDEHERVLRELGIVSVMAVPMRVAGRNLGAVMFVSAESGRRFDENDLRLAEELARRFASAVENARLYRELGEAGAELQRSRDQLHAILEGIADGVTAQEPSGRLIYANEAAVHALRYDSAEELLAADPADIIAKFEVMDEDGKPFPLEMLPGRRALLGEHPAPRTLRFIERATGEERWSVVKATPILGSDSQPVLAINIIEDVTETKRVERAQAFLAEASRVLAGSLDLETTLQMVTQLAVPDIADWCGIDLVDERGNIEHVAVHHVDPGRVTLADELRAEYPTDPESETGVPAVVRSGRSEIYPDITDEMIDAAARDDRHRELLGSVGLVSAMVVPMIAAGRTLGAITFATAESGHHYDEEDLRLAEELGRRAATAIQNARLYSERSYIARTLQESLLPPHLPQLPGVELAARYHAAGEAFEVGGDFYDIFQTGPMHWTAVIGDVRGKGPRAASVTALARYTVRAAAMRETTPSRVLEMLNEAMRRQNFDDRFCTVAIASLQPSPSGVRLTVSCGGHPMPIVLRANGDVEPVGQPGTLLGLVADPELADESLELAPGDSVILYTDGVSEARSETGIFGEARLLALIQSCTGLDAARIVERIQREVLEYQDAEPRDDIALVVLRVRERDALMAGDEETAWQVAAGEG
jgi:PAS domain S-box-containing protein